MSMLTDPDMEEIVIDFCDEADKVYNEVEEILESYEDNPEPQKLEKFGQIIDRVMGAAKSIDAEKSGIYSELGKTISYKASQSMDQGLLDIVVAVLFDTIDILKIMNKNIRTKKEEAVDGINIDAFATRLHWLAEKFKDIQRSSVTIAPDSNKKLEDQKSIDQLLADLGL